MEAFQDLDQALMSGKSTDLLRTLGVLLPDVPSKTLHRVAAVLVTARSVGTTTETSFYPFQKLAVAVLATLGSVAAGTCSLLDRRFEAQVLGRGGQNEVRTNLLHTGVQKTFKMSHAGRAGVVMLMQNEGVFAPRVRACHNDSEANAWVITSALLDTPGTEIVNEYGVPQPGWEKPWADFVQRIKEFESKYSVKMWDVVVTEDGSPSVDWSVRDDQPGGNGWVNRALRLNRNNFRADRYRTIYVTDADWVAEAGDFVRYTQDI